MIGSWLIEKLAPMRSPLTDPRSLSLTIVVHACLFAIASLIVFDRTVSHESDASRPLRGELGAVDNRAAVARNDGGGSEGSVGGRSTIEVAADSDAGSAAHSSDAASNLIREALGETEPSPEPADQARSDLSTSGLGVIGGPANNGGGGGSGGGSGGGVGRGVGPGTAFFGIREQASSYTYVIDCSGSMSVDDALGRAKRELMTSLSKLPGESQFGIVFYNTESTVFTDAEGRRGLMPASNESKERVRTLLARVDAKGGTDHLKALRAGLALHAEAIFFLTDGDSMTVKEAETIARSAGKTRIRVIEFGIGRDTGGSTPLRTLGTLTGGSYRYIDVGSLK